MFPLFILIVSGVAIYGLPYFRYTYWNTFMDVYGLNDAQMANLQTVYGILCLICYFPGGWLADRVSTKKLLAISFLGTGLSGLYLMTIPSYEVVLAIHGLWGITTILTFWPAFIKALRSLGNEDEQGKVYGFMESGRGIANIVVASIALAIFAMFEKKGAEGAMLKVVLFYSLVLIVVGIIAVITFKEDNESINKTKDASKDVSKERISTVSLFMKVIKRPSVWLISGIVFCSYFMNIAFYSVSPYSEDIMMLTPAMAGAMVVIAQWARPLSALLAGIFGDIISVSKTVQIGFLSMIVGMLGVIFLPASASYTIIFIIFLVFVYIGMYALQANHFALLEQGDIPSEETGMAVGVISTLGYLPEVLASQVGLIFMTKFSNNGVKTVMSYKSYYMFLVGIFILGIIFTLIFNKIYGVKGKKAKLEIEA